MNTDQITDEAGNVKHCPDCGCKTWHFNGVCEWSDGHKKASPDTKGDRDDMLDAAGV